MIALSTEQVHVNPVTNQPMVFLKANDQDRYLLVKLTPSEANTIAFSLQGTTFQPPFAHDLMKNLVEGMGATVTRVVISGFSDDLFSAQIILDVASKEMTFNGRASDALALALRAKAPIFVEEHILDQKGIPLEQEYNAGATPPRSQKAGPKQVERDIEVRELLTLKISLKALQEQFAQIEGELIKAQERIAALESK